MSRWTKVALALLCLIAFAAPFEYEYNKLFRHFSLILIPEGLVLPKWFNKKITFYRSDLAAIALFLIALFGLRIPLRRLLFEKGAFFLWLIFLFALFSITISPLAHYPIAYTRLLQLLTPFLLFSFCANGFSPEWRPKVTQWILASFVFAGFFQVGIAITQYFSQAPLGLRPFGEVQQCVSAFKIPSGNRWIFDRLFHHSLGTTTLWRALGTFSHPNALGGFLALSLLSSYSLAIELKRSWIRKTLALSLPIQFFALSLTFSRAGIFGWTLGTFAWFALVLRQMGIRNCLSHAPFRLLAFMVALSPLITVSLLSEQFSHRGGLVNYNAVSRASDVIRLEYQSRAFKLLRQKPFTGVGFQQYSLANEAAGAPHNIYLLLAAETGLFSLAAFLAFIFLLLRASLRLTFTFQTASLLSIFFAFLFIGCCDFYLILFQAGKIMFFSIAGLLAAQAFHKREMARKGTF